MCDICVMNAVKDKMLSRRSFFKGAAVSTAAAAAGTVMSAPSALAAGHSSVEDMTHTLYPQFPTWGGEETFSMDE